MDGKKILIIDDEEAFLKMIIRFFDGTGAKIVTARDGMEGLSKALTHRPDLIILDIMMPNMDGFQVCRILRQFTKVPLLMLSALDQDQLLVRGLEAGADDFLTKPISPEALLAHIKAVLRRSEHTYTDQAAIIYNDGHLLINVEKHRVYVRNKRIKHTPVEFRLLVYLVSNSDRVLSFEEILSNVWGSEYIGNDEFVHVYVSHLRGKIEVDTKSPRYIISVHGVGYMFEKQESSVLSSD